MFRRQNIFEKKMQGKMLIKQTYEFELRGPGPPSCRPTCTITSGCFYDKTKTSSRKSSIGLLFAAKILHEAMYLAFPYLGQIIYKI